MFNTSGYFKGLNCPYFAGGLCERPYCHFRHVKPVSDEKSGDGYTTCSDAGSASKPSLLNMVGDAIRQVQRDIEKDKARLSSPSNGPVVYNPTPLAHCSTATRPPLQRENNLKRVTIPQYNPTPIRLLKKQKAAQKQKRTHSELEYDPATNFSTSSNGTVVKKVTIADEPKQKYLKTEESNDSDIEAMFSDDEDATVSSTALDANQAETVKDIKKAKEPSKKGALKSSHKKGGSGCKNITVVKIKKEPADESDKVNIQGQKSDKDQKNIFDLVNVKTEKCDQLVSVKSEKSTDEAKKTSSSSEKASSHKDHKGSEYSRKRSHSSEKGKSTSKEGLSSLHGSKQRDEKRRHSSSESKKSEGRKKDEDRSSLDKSKSSRSHHRSSSSSSSHKSSHRNHNNSTSSQDSGKSKSNRDHDSSDKKRKERKNTDRKESTDSHGSDKGKHMNFASLFGPEIDDEVVVLSDQEPQKDVVELSSEEEVLDLEELFNEDSPEKLDDIEETEVQVLVKKRVAHAAAANNTATQKRCSVDIPKARPSPAEVLYNRMKEMKRRAEEQAQKVQEGKVSSTSSIGSEKKRLADASSFSNKKSKVEPADSSTQAKTVNKGEKRKAHMPSKAALVRPIIPADHNSKVPANVRQRYLNTFIDECLKIYPSEQDACDRGVEEEKQVYARSGTRVVYLNNAVNTVKKLRTEAKSGVSSDNLSPMAKVKTEKTFFTSPKKGTPTKPGTPSPKKQVMLSHEAILGGKKGSQSNFTVKRSGKQAPVPDKFSGAELYKYLQPYILNEEQLFDNGFPLPDSELPGSAVVNVLNDSDKIASKANERICRRCGKRFLITEDGKCVIQEQCVHHWGKAFKRKIAGQWDHRYTCCSGDLSAKGCHIGQRHVHDQNKYEDFTGYRQTKPSSSKTDGNYGVYALDCEMVYTEGGFELARVTVIDESCEVALESKVIPDYPVVDYNTRFSGVTEADMAGVTTTLRDIQKMLLRMFSDKTILIGHSLESDMVALKLIHETVVDTSVVFPHKLGPPYKKALRTLMADYMQKIIQNDEDGHDSKEDAVSCMEIMLWKVKEDVKRARRRN